ncbi:MAG: hypothetical protein E6538_17530, partial [Paeniclostridium sordellii]|nr:hypothetical protein [Paeniclostridium sordellii]
PYFINSIPKTFDCCKTSLTAVKTFLHYIDKALPKECLVASRNIPREGNRPLEVTILGGF